MGPAPDQRQFVNEARLGFPVSSSGLVHSRDHGVRNVGADRYSSRGRVFALLVVALLAIVYSVYSIARYQRFEASGYDLGIFMQEVKSYADGQWPTSLLKGPHFALMGDHFSPIMALLAPFWWVFPSASTLLIAQAVLIALSAWPMVVWGSRTIGTPMAVVVALCYGASWGVSAALGFDVHEVMFAAPLLAFSLVRLAEGRFVAAVAWAAPLVLVKEDLGVTVAAIGLLIAWRGRRIRRIRALGLALAATLVEVYLIIPAVARGHYAYAHNITLGSILSAGAPVAKWWTLGLVLIVTAGLALRSPLALMALPTLVWRMASNDPAYWGSSDQYSLVLMPIMFVAMLDALRRIRRPRWRWAWVAGAVLAAIVTVPNFPLYRLPHLIRTTPADRQVSAALDTVPAGVTVAASNWLAPHLIASREVSLFGHAPYAVDYIVVDTSPSAPMFPLTHSQQARELARASAVGYRLVDDIDGVLILKNENGKPYK